MKKHLIFLLTLSTLFCFGQDLPTTIEVRPAFGKSLAKETIIVAGKFDDLIPFYPHSWIEEYIGTTVSIKKNGKLNAAEGTSNLFSKSQQQAVKTVEVGDELLVSIRYNSKNSVTGLKEKNAIELKYTVTADQEAKPVAGLEKIRSFFKENAFKSFTDGKGTDFAGAAIQFVIDEKGEIGSANLKQSSGNMDADQRLLKSIRQMPAWKPAQDKMGKKYRQEFVLEVVRAGC